MYGDNPVSVCVLLSPPVTLIVKLMFEVTLVYIRLYPVIGPFLLEQGTSSQDTVKESALTDEKIMLPTGEVGPVIRNK